MVQQSFTSTLFLFLYSLHVAIIMANTSHSTMMCHDNERSALLHFKHGFSVNEFASSDSSAYPKTESWKARGESSSNDCCSWDGVECDEYTGYVIGLDLSSSLLYGTLHPNSTLFSLVHLHTLNLAANNFNNSPIPHQISHFSSLSSLNLSNSQFSGQIPFELSGLSKLTSLDLSYNNLYGCFPIAIFHLPDLLVLNASSNKNLAGSLPEFNKTSSFRELKLSRTIFSGNLPVSIGNLQSLNKLGLADCNFSGSIPVSIGNLTQLTYLSLYSNEFKQEKLSWLDKLTKLTFLDLHATNLYGEIPSSLANLTHLGFLYLNSNQLTGVIPSSLTNMTQLIELDLSSNLLNGPISSSFTQLKNLESIILHKNNFSGIVEVDIFLSLKKLKELNLSANKIRLLTHHNINSSHPQFTGLQLDDCNLREFPYFLQFQIKLEKLFLRGNKIQGQIPHWIWEVSDRLEAIFLSDNFLTTMELNPSVLPGISLAIIEISNNLLQGNLPVPPPNIISYKFSKNSLIGDISPMICGVRSLQILDLSNNNMSGAIPQCLGSSLTALDLQGNNFSGTIPQAYFKGCKLKVMDLSQNQLEGGIPKSLSNCKMLQILDLADNQIEDTFPLWLGALPQLQVLVLHSNRLHGAITSSGSASVFPLLRIIDLSGNSFNGTLPSKYIQIWNAHVMKILEHAIELYIKTESDFEIGNSEWLGYSYGSSITITNKGAKREYKKIQNYFRAIDLSCNKFTGEISESVGNLERLQLLNLSNNELTGPIPPSLGNLTKLESLDLSHNKLSGVIPQQIANLNFLEFFNVSYNLLIGHIPEGRQLQTFYNTSYMGNSGLCGFPLSNKCETLRSDVDDSDNELPSGYNWVFIYAGAGSGLVVGFVWGNILTDRHPWLIGSFVQRFAGKQRNRRRKRQTIRI